MFRLNLNLSQKAFLLVALPLICELIVLGSLAVLLTQAEEETRKERHARQVIAESNLLLKDFLDCSIYSYQLNKMRDPATMKQFDALYEQIPMRIRSLKIELRDSPDQKAALERIEQVASKGIEMLAEFRRIALEGGSIVELAEKRRILSQQGQLLLDTIRHFVNAQESALLSKPDTEFKFRMLIVQCIGSGVLASIILAVALTMYFNRGTMRRLSVLMDNTSRLAKGQPLNPVVTGGDEIAHLDKIFHEMADALADAARRKQELMSMVSHDLRTPLTSMQGSLTLLNEGILGKLPERAEHEVARAEKNTARLINLINDLLDIEKLEAGQMEMKLKNIPLWPVIEQSVDAVSHFASSHGVTIDAQPCAQAVYGDHDRLIQVVVNLLSNAVKFSPQGASVFVSFDEHDSFVTVNVKDAGRGVPDQYKALIFERFKQVKSEDATEKKGTGLGLPICKMIVESHGGTIGVESKEGEGSTFWFRIPKAKQ